MITTTEQLTTAQTAKSTIATIYELMTRYYECDEANWPPHLSGIIDEMEDFAGETYLQEDRHNVNEPAMCHQFWIELPDGSSGDFELMITGLIFGTELSWTNFRLIYELFGEEINVGLAYHEKKVLYEFVKVLTKNWNWGIE